MSTKRIGDVLSELMSRRGYARVQASVLYSQAWQEAAGELLARYTRVGKVRRGSLELVVANSTWMQEITFEKQAILKRLAQLLPEERIVELRMRVGPIE